MKDHELTELKQNIFSTIEKGDREKLANHLTHNGENKALSKLIYDPKLVNDRKDSIQPKDKLLELVPDKEHAIFIELLLYAIDKKQLDIVKYLLGRQEIKGSLLITQTALIVAIVAGCPEIVKYMLSIPEIVTNTSSIEPNAVFVDSHASMNSALLAIVFAAIHGRVNILEQLLNINEINQHAVKSLELVSPEDDLRMILLETCVEKNQLPIITYMFSRPEINLNSETLTEFIFNALVMAASQDRLHIVKYVLNLAEIKLDSKLFLKGLTVTLESAANSGNISTVEYISNHPVFKSILTLPIMVYSEVRINANTVERVLAVQTNIGYSTLQSAIQGNQLAMVKYLLDLPDIKQTKPIFNSIEFCIEQKAILVAIMYGKADIVNHLLEIPNAVKDLQFCVSRELKLALDNGYNELISKVISKLKENSPETLNTLFECTRSLGEEMNPLLELLLQEESVSQYAMKHPEPVPNPMGMWKAAHKPEGSMASLSSSESNVVESLKLKYKAQFEAQGNDAILERLKHYLTTKYKENPVRTQGELNPDELNAYYQNQWHTAWRYLFCSPNKWIGQTHEYAIEVDGGGYKANINKADRELLAYIWLDVENAQQEFVNGFDSNSAKEHVVRELAALGRAHNRDKGPDDMQGDNPSCVSGIRKRLMQFLPGSAIFEHPLARQLDCDTIILKFAEEVAIASLQSHLGKLDITQCKTVLKEAEERLGEEYENSTNFKISSEQVELFTNICKEYYGAHRILNHQDSLLKLQANTFNTYQEVIVQLANDPWKYCFERMRNITQGKIKQLETEKSNKPSGALIASKKSLVFSDLKPTNEKKSASEKNIGTDAKSSLSQRM